MGCQVRANQKPLVAQQTGFTERTRLLASVVDRRPASQPSASVGCSPNAGVRAIEAIQKVRARPNLETASGSLVAWRASRLCSGPPASEWAVDHWRHQGGNASRLGSRQANVGTPPSTRRPASRHSRPTPTSWHRVKHPPCPGPRPRFRMHASPLPSRSRPQESLCRGYKHAADLLRERLRRVEANLVLSCMHPTQWRALPRGMPSRQLKRPKSEGVSNLVGRVRMRPRPPAAAPRKRKHEMARRRRFDSLPPRRIWFETTPPSHADN